MVFCSLLCFSFSRGEHVPTWATKPSHDFPFYIVISLGMLTMASEIILNITGWYNLPLYYQQITGVNGSFEQWRLFGTPSLRHHGSKLRQRVSWQDSPWLGRFHRENITLKGGKFEVFNQRRGNKNSCNKHGNINLCLDYSWRFGKWATKK